MFNSILNLFATKSAQPPVSKPAPQPSPKPVSPSSTSIARKSPQYVQDHRGVSKPLGDILDQGGEGIVYLLPEQTGFLAKIYHPSLSGRQRERAQKKITEMTSMSDLKNNSQLAWPRVSLFDQQGRWCGYAMSQKVGISLRELLGSPMNFGASVPHWHRQHLIRLCLDFLSTIKELSNHQVLPIDFNPSNFLVNTETIRMHFIDCDSYQFQGKERIHLSEVILPEMAAPEIVRANNWSQLPVAPQCLKFSVAMLLYYILNLGNSPYRHRNGTDPVKNLLSGKCALGKGADCQLPRGATFKIWSHLTYDLKSLFISCFRDGHRDPTARPSIRQWETALHNYNHHIQKGHHDASVIPPQSKSSSH